MVGGAVLWEEANSRRSVPRGSPVFFYWTAADTDASKPFDPDVRKHPDVIQY